MACRNDTIRVNKPTDFGIVITAGYIIESRLGIVVVASIAEGVTEHDAGGVGEGLVQGVGNGDQVAPGIVGVVTHPLDFLLLGIRILPREEDALHVALGIGGVVILCEAAAAVGGVEEGEGSALIVVDEVHDHRAVPVGEAFPDHSAVEGQVGVGHTVNHLLGANAVCIVVVGADLPVYGEARKLSAVLPGQIGVGLGAIGVEDGVAAYYSTADRCSAESLTFVDNGRTVDCSEEILPLVVTVGIRLGGAACGLGKNVAGGIVGVGVGCGDVGLGLVCYPYPRCRRSASPNTGNWKLCPMP